MVQVSNSGVVNVYDLKLSPVRLFTFVDIPGQCQ
nr:MAG TPA: hypothetical protein [Caudoviricetes sp.]